MTTEETATPAADSGPPEPAPAYPAPPDINLPFEPMATPEAESEPSYSDDFDGLSQAAAELQARRSVLEEPEIERTYRDGGGFGERTPANQFASVEKAADDLANVRRTEEAALAELKNAEVRRLADELRGAQPQPEPPVETPQPEITPQAEAAPDVQETPLQAALRTQPELRTQVQQLIEGVEAHKQQLQQNVEAQRQQLQQEFTQRANQAALETQALLGQLIPELLGAQSDAVAQDRLNQIRVNNPARWQQITATLEHVRSGYANAQRAYEQQLAEYNQRQTQAQAQHQAEFSRWADQQDAAFDKSETSAGRGDLKTIQERMPAILEQKYGISMKELSQLYQTQPFVRHAGVQRLLANAMRYELAQEQIANARVNNIPQVQRPGVSQPRDAESGRYSSAASAFAANPTAKLGAALIAARRGNR